MDTPETNDILRLHKCPECSYDLKGLPREGRCPECGFAYDAMMFSLLGRPKRGGHKAMGCLAFLFSFYGIGFLALDLRLGAIFIGLAIPTALLSSNRWQRIWRNEPQWLLFTDRGVASRHTEGSLYIIPWFDFKRVTVQRVFSFQKEGEIGKWEIRLFREPRLTLLDPTKHKGFLAGDRGGSEIAFRIVVTEAEATQIVNRLRECFTRGWAVRTQPAKSEGQTPTAADP